MAGLAIITEACIDVKDRACVDVCPVQCIYEFDPGEQRAVLRGGGRQRGRSRTRTHAESGRDRDLRRQHAVREPRRVHVVHRVLPARRVPGRRDLLRGARARRIANDEVQPGQIRTRATTTRSSSSTAATSSPTEQSKLAVAGQLRLVLVDKHSTVRSAVGVRSTHRRAPTAQPAQRTDASFARRMRSTSDRCDLLPSAVPYRRARGFEELGFEGRRVERP